MEINNFAMGSLRVKKSVLRKIKVQDVIKELKSNNYFDKAHCEMMECIKDTLAYKQMREVAVSHMFNTLTSSTGFPDAKAREEKRNQVSRIGALAIHINSAISKVVSQRVSQEGAATAAKRALIRLAEKKTKYYDYYRRKKGKQNQALTEFPHVTNESKEEIKDNESGSDISLDDVSYNSVSSVHTSDLSSFDENIVVSSEDETGKKKRKIISFNSANKAYFDDGFSDIHDLIVRQKILANKECEKSETEKKFLSYICKNSNKPKKSITRPKRERKPNSKYSPNDMYV